MSFTMSPRERKLYKQFQNLVGDDLVVDQFDFVTMLTAEQHRLIARGAAADFGDKKLEELALRNMESWFASPFMEPEEYAAMAHYLASAIIGPASLWAVMLAWEARVLYIPQAT